MTVRTVGKLSVLTQPSLSIADELITQRSALNVPNVVNHTIGSQTSLHTRKLTGKREPTYVKGVGKPSSVSLISMLMKEPIQVRNLINVQSATKLSITSQTLHDIKKFIWVKSLINVKNAIKVFPASQSSIYIRKPTLVRSLMNVQIAGKPFSISHNSLHIGQFIHLRIFMNVKNVINLSTGSVNSQHIRKDIQEEAS